MASQQGGRYYTGVGFIDKGIGHVMNLLSDQLPVCKMPGCNKQCYVENDGRVHDFCSKTHAREFQQQKMMRDKRLKAVQHGQSTGGHGGWQGPHSYCTAAAYGTGPSGPSYTRSGTPYGAYMVNQPTTCVTDQYGMGQGPIRFYNKDEPYYEFTNFYPAPIDLDGKTWPTTEHYFQAQKFIGTSFPEVIRNFERPRQAFDLSRNPTVSRWRRKDWEDIKINIMRKALLAKFTQHKRLRQLLLSTRDNMLIEHTPYDKFWGDGGDGSGENHLGMILMEIRQLLINLQASLRQERVTPDSHREHVQRSASTEKDGQSHLSSSSSSSMDYMNAEAENTHHDQQNHDSHQVQANQDPQNINLTRSPLHPKAAENAGSPPHQQLPTGGEGSPQGKPASATTPNSAPVQMQSEPPVGNLIDLNDAEPPEEDKKNPIMTGKVPQNLKQPLQPVSLGQRVNQAPDTSTNVGKESDKDDQPEQMDTSGPNNIH